MAHVNYWDSGIYFIGHWINSPYFELAKRQGRVIGINFCISYLRLIRCLVFIVEYCCWYYGHYEYSVVCNCVGSRGGHFRQSLHLVVENRRNSDNESVDVQRHHETHSNDEEKSEVVVV